MIAFHNHVACAQKKGGSKKKKEGGGGTALDPAALAAKRNELEVTKSYVKPS